MCRSADLVECRLIQSESISLELMAMELQLLPFDIVDGVAQLEQFMIHGLRFVDVRAM